MGDGEVKVKQAADPSGREKGWASSGPRETQIRVRVESFECVSHVDCDHTGRGGARHHSTPMRFEGAMAITTTLAAASGRTEVKLVAYRTLRERALL
jgi:hypothetical protein